MRYLVFGGSTILIFFLIRLLRLLTIKKQLNTIKHTQVRLPKMNFWIGLTGLLVFSSFMALGCLFPDFITGLDIFTFLGFCLFDILSATLMVGYINCRIEILEKTFIYHTFFGRKYEIRYIDILRSREGRTATHIYTINKHLFLDHSAVGDTAFFLKWDENQRIEQRKRLELISKND